MAELKGLTRLRKRALLSRKDLAAQVGVSVQSIWAWEAGESWPRPDHVRKLAEVLGTEVSSVLDALEEAAKRWAA